MDACFRKLVSFDILNEIIFNSNIFFLMLASLYSEEVSIFEKYEILSHVMCENGS